jgi:hypothetical protein
MSVTSVHSVVIREYIGAGMDGTSCPSASSLFPETAEFQYGRNF